MGAELPRPGVEVIQVFRSTSPTVVTPTLVPCIVGVCRQVVDVLEASSGGGTTLNNDALVPVPAQFIAAPAGGGHYTGLDGLKLVLSIDHNPPVTTVFAGSSLTPAQVVTEIQNAFTAAGVTAATVEAVSTDRFMVRSTANGQYETIDVIVGTGGTDTAVLSAFGLGARTYAGRDGYDQASVVLSPASFPDPRKNLDQLVIENDSVRAFLYLGGATPTLKELLRDQSYLRRGTSGPATLTFTGDLSVGATLTALLNKTLILTFNGGTPLTVTFGTVANAAAVVAAVNAVISSVGVASLDTAGTHLVIKTLANNITATIGIPTGTAGTQLGYPVAAATGTTAARTVTPSNGQAVSSLIQFPGLNFTSSATAAAILGSAAIPAGGVADGTTLTVADGASQQTVTFMGATTPTLVVSQINAVMGTGAGGQLLASVSSTKLLLTSLELGEDSYLQVVGGTAVGPLFLTTGTTAYGTSFPVAAGDDLYIGGVLYATVTQVAPGGATDTLKINKSVALSTNLGDNFYIRAKNLTDSTTYNVTRPIPEFQMDLQGNGRLKNGVLRDTTGTTVPGAAASIYISYSAIREDVSPLATNPGLLKYNDTTTLNTDLAPLSPVNPLALGLYFALLNSPGVQVTGIGVDAISDNAPNGTVEAFTRAAEFLEAFEVYAIAPMTHDTTVAQIFNTHVTVMSEPGNKGERIALFNPSKPDHKLDTLVSSGVAGNTTQTSNQFDTGIQNLASLLLNAGLDPTGPIAVSAGLYLAVTDSDGKYAITSISGSKVNVQTTNFNAGDNTDGYYATTTLPTPLIGEAFAIRLRGASLATVSGVPDKDSIADTYAGMAATYLNRRFWHVAPDTTAATINGLEQEIEGFYLCAAIAGMIGQQPPQQSFTNFPMTGFTRVIGSNDFFTEKQLNRMAAGGNYIVVQDAQGAPLIARMALTTDLTSIETRTDSITKVVDYCAKFLRRGLKNFIGRFNITQGFLDSLGHVIQGLLGFLSDTGVLIGSQLNNIVQDESAPDTVLIDITLDVPFPCNYIRLTLVV